MSRTRIGGRIDLAALGRLSRPDLESRALEHAPRTREELRAAVHELASRGYAPSTIAVACRITLEQVRQVLGPSESVQTPARPPVPSTAK